MLGYIDNFYEKNNFLNTKNFKIVWNGNFLWVCNFIKVLEYSMQLVKLKICNNCIIIEGDNIIIKMLDKKEIILQGDIYKVYLKKCNKANENEKSTKI